MCCFLPLPRARETSEGGGKNEGGLSHVFSPFATEKMTDFVINDGAL